MPAAPPPVATLILAPPHAPALRAGRTACSQRPSAAGARPAGRRVDHARTKADLHTSEADNTAAVIAENATSRPARAACCPAGRSRPQQQHSDAAPVRPGDRGDMAGAPNSD